MTRLPGLVLMGLSALSFSLMAAAIKALKDDFPAAEIVFFRGVLCALITLAAMRATSTSVFGKRRRLLALRGFLGFVALYLYCLALGRIPLPDAMALQYTHPVFAAVFAALFLRERMPRGSGLALAICAAGALVVLQPRGTGSLAGNLIGLASGVASGLAYTCVRSLGKTESPLTIMMSFHLAATLFGGLTMTHGFVMPAGMQWAWIAAIALLSQSGQWCLTHGLRKEQAGVATTVGYIAIAFGALWAWLFFAETITVAVTIGTVIMVSGLALLVRDRPATSAASSCG